MEENKQISHGELQVIHVDTLSTGEGIITHQFLSVGFS